MAGKTSVSESGLRKIAGYYKGIKNLPPESVVLKTDYDGLEVFDRIFVAKVFTDTPVPEWLRQVSQPKELLIRVGKPDAGELPVEEWLEKTVGCWYEGKIPVNVGGTGFFFDRAPNLPHVIEHCLPDYHLYDAWIEEKIRQAEEGRKRRESRLFYPGTGRSSGNTRSTAWAT